MIMNKRVEYFMDYNDQIGSTRKSPPNPSIYFCSKMLPAQIVFETTPALAVGLLFTEITTSSGDELHPLDVITNV